MFTRAVYESRRSRLCEKMVTGLIFLPGNVDASMNYPDNIYTFRQDSSFLYFIGLDIPGVHAAIDIDSQKTTLFADELTMHDIIWTGPKESFAALAQRAGILSVKPLNQLQSIMEDATKKGRIVHYLPPYRAETILALESLLKIPSFLIKDKASLSLIKAVVALRSIKGVEEMIELDKAAEIGYLMHEYVMKNAHPGKMEKELAGMAEGIALSKGAGVSFPVILTQRGEVLHGHEHSATLQKGNLVLCDAGAESSEHYASDFTRTIPVGGRFSQIQRTLYQLVLDANNRALQLIKPGLYYRDIHMASCLVLLEGLKDLGVLKGDTQDALVNGAHALFMVHGLGHMLGMDVHDMEGLGEDHVGYDETIKRSTQFGLSSLRLGRKLEPGFVLTVEPGLYFVPSLIEKWKAEKHLCAFINYEKAMKLIGTGGIRIEDNVIVTDNGNRMPGSKRLPVFPEEIEGFYSSY
jgi:Xaa-Pro aminopeptidase